MPQPTLTTPRLTLRPFNPSDAPHVRRLADDPDIAANTLTIPHPYPPGHAEAWIATHAPAFDAGLAAVFAITDTQTTDLRGAAGLHLEPDHARAELGYWIGRPFWNHGYATEAARALLAFGFEHLALARIHAAHFPHNPASARILRKLGLRHEGTLRAHVLKNGRRIDLVVYAALREEWQHGGYALELRPRNQQSRASTDDPGPRTTTAPRPGAGDSRSRVSP